MVINPAFTALTDTTMQKDTSKEITILYKDKSNPQSYKYLMGTFQLPLTNINSGGGLMVNYNTMNYDFKDFYQFPPVPSGFNPMKTQINSYYTEFVEKLYYRYTFNNKLSVGADAGFINYNFLFNVPGESYVIHPHTLYSDVGMLYMGAHWLFGVSFGSNFTSYSNLPYSFFEDGFPNYTSFIYTVMGEYRTRFKNHMKLDILTYTSNSLSNLEGTVYLKHTIFFGASLTAGNIINVINNDYVFTGGNYAPATFNSGSYYITIEAGLSLFHDRLKVTLSYDIFPKSISIGGPQNIESVISDRFN
jgi:hypothetical protein